MRFSANFKEKFPLAQSRLGRNERSQQRQLWVGTWVGIRAPEGWNTHHRAAPWGLFNIPAPLPAVSTMGYGLTSLRDFQRRRTTTPRANRFMLRFDDARAGMRV